MADIDIPLDPQVPVRNPLRVFDVHNEPQDGQMTASRGIWSRVVLVSDLINHVIITLLLDTHLKPHILHTHTDTHSRSQLHTHTNTHSLLHT